MSSELHEKLFKSGLKHYGSPLPLLDKPICGLWEKTKPYNCPKPCIFRLVPKWRLSETAFCWSQYSHNKHKLTFSPCFTLFKLHIWEYLQIQGMWLTLHGTLMLYCSNYFKHLTLVPLLSFPLLHLSAFEYLWKISPFLVHWYTPKHHAQNETNADGENTHCCVTARTVEAIESSLSGKIGY